MDHLKNILYSLYLGSNISFVLKYISSLFKGKKIFKKNLEIKTLFENEIHILKKKNILAGLNKQNINYNIPFIYEILKNFNYIEKKIQILIIGCFEGHSTIFFLMHTKNSFFECVDNWNQENLIRYSLSAENFFDKNIKNYKHRVNKNKKNSDNFFEANKKNFDLIYIDGSHFHNDVERDCLNSFTKLSINGLLIINSVFWRGKKWKLSHNNLSGILRFLKKTKNYKILLITRNTLFIKKINL